MGEKYPEYGFMLVMYKHKSVTLEEIMIVNRILVGCAKYVKLGHKKPLKSHKLSKKSLASMLIYSGLTSELHSSFRPAKIRATLPDEVSRIDPANLSRLLKVYVRAKIIEKTDPPKSTRGKPAQLTNQDQPGKKSYFQSTEYIQMVKQVISKPLIRMLIFSYLL